MADKPNKAEADRILYEYQRQLNAPKIFSEKYPNISKTIDSTILHKSDKDIYNKLGEHTEVPEQYAKDPFSWYRAAEENATDALNKDYYKASSPMELLNKLKAQDKLNYAVDTGTDLKKEFSGVFDPNTNTMSLDTKGSPKTQMDTAIHEHGHADDMYNNFDKFRDISNNKPNEPNEPDGYLAKGWDKWGKMKEDNNLYDLSDSISTGHFIKPRSHSINTLIDKAEAIGKENGLVRMPDQDPRYNELNIIKPTLKELQQYPIDQPTMFQKLKGLLGKR